MRAPSGACWWPTALYTQITARICDYPKSTPWGSVLVVGDLNVCISNNLDTDRVDLPTDDLELEAEVLQTFMAVSLWMTFSDLSTPFKRRIPIPRAGSARLILNAV